MGSAIRAIVIAAVGGCLTAATIVGQNSPKFEAASIRIVQLSSHPIFKNWGGPGTGDPSRIHLCCIGMFSLLMRAFDADIDQIVGPSWIMENMGPNLYQLDATMPADTTKEQLQLMLQSLLRDRFHLQVHFEKRPFPGYELIVGEKGPKFKESHPDPNVTTAHESEQPKRALDGSLVLPPGPQMFTSLGRGMIIVQAQEKPLSELVKSMGRLIEDSLGNSPNDYTSPKPRVIDKTRLTGNYDFTLRFSCEACQFGATNGTLAALPSLSDSDSTAGAANIFAALQQQLGLKLVKVKDIPLNVIIVDHVDKTPADN